MQPGPANLRALAVTAGFAVVLVGGLDVGHVQPPPVDSAASVLVTGGAPRSGCTPLVAAVPADDVPVVAPLVAAYNRSPRTVDGRCVDVRISPTASGDAADALVRGWKESVDGPAPQVWLPGSSTWLELVRARQGAGASVLPDSSPTYAQSPLVIAMPRPMAQALGWPGREIGFSDLVALGQDPKGWGHVGHPEWGPLRLGKTSPILSTTGLDALIAEYFAATGVAADLTAANLTDPRTVAFARGVEAATVHYGESSVDFLQSLRRADGAGDSLGYVSAVMLEERQVLAYNAGDPSGALDAGGTRTAPRVPLVAVYPKEGTVVADNPFVVLDAPWVSPGQRDAARDLLSFLLAPAQQHRLQQAGLRDAQGRPGPQFTASAGLLPDHPRKVVTPPAGSVLDLLQRSWYGIRKPVRVLVLVDTSGSMDSEVDGTGKSKLELVKAALLSAIDQIGDGDELGLTSFSDTETSLVPIGPVGSQRAALKAAVAGMTAGGATSLYDSIAHGLAEMDSTADPTHIDAMVVLTDGEDTSSQSSLDTLLAAEAAQPAGASVRVFTIAYGQDASRDVLGQIAQASQAGTYDASNPTLIQQVFNAVLSNF